MSEVGGVTSGAEPTVSTNVIIKVENKEAIRDMGAILDRIANGSDIHKYWAEQETLIKRVIDAYEQYKSKLDSGRYVGNEAVELLNTYNAAYTKLEGRLAESIPQLSEITAALSSAASHVPDGAQLYTNSEFKSLFGAFDVFKAYDASLTGVGAFGNAVKNVRAMRDQIQDLNEELRDAQKKLSEIDAEKFEHLKSELDELKERLSGEFGAFLRTAHIDTSTYGVGSDWYNEISQGRMTSSEAIADFKSANSYLLDGGGYFDADQIERFAEALDRISNNIYELNERFEAFANGGMAHARAQADNFVSELSGMGTQGGASNQGFTSAEQSAASFADALSGLDAKLGETVGYLKNIGEAVSGTLSPLNELVRLTGELNSKSFAFNFNISDADTAQNAIGSYIERVREYVRDIQQMYSVLGSIKAQPEWIENVGSNMDRAFVGVKGFFDGSYIRAFEQFEKRLNSVSSFAGAERIAKDAKPYLDSINEIIAKANEVGALKLKDGFGVFPEIPERGLDSMSRWRDLLGEIGIKSEGTSRAVAAEAEELSKTNDEAGEHSKAMAEAAEAERLKAEESKKLKATLDAEAKAHKDVGDGAKKEADTISEEEKRKRREIDESYKEHEAILAKEEAAVEEATQAEIAAYDRVLDAEAKLELKRLGSEFKSIKDPSSLFGDAELDENDVSNAQRLSDLYADVAKKVYEISSKKKEFSQEDIEEINNLRKQIENIGVLNNRLTEIISLKRESRNISDETPTDDELPPNSAEQYRQTTSAAKEYYRILTEVAKTEHDIALSKIWDEENSRYTGTSRYESASGKYQALADTLNNAKAALDAMLDSEHTALLTEEEQLNVQRLLTDLSQKYELELEKIANKQDAVSKKNSLKDSLREQNEAFKHAKQVVDDYFRALSEYDKSPSSMEYSVVDGKRTWTAIEGQGSNTLAAQITERAAAFDKLTSSETKAALSESQWAAIQSRITNLEAERAKRAESNALAQREAAKADEERARNLGAIERALKEINAANAGSGKLDKSLEDANLTGEEKVKVEALGNAYNELYDKFAVLRSASSDYSDNRRTEIENLGREISENIRLREEILATAEARAESQKPPVDLNQWEKEKLALAERIKLEYQQIEKNLRKWTAIKGTPDEKNLKDYLNGLKDLEKSLRAISAGTDLTTVREKFNEISDSVKSTNKNISVLGNNTSSFMSKLGSAAQKFGSWLSVSQVIMAVIRSARRMVTTAIELDDKMTQLRIVTDESAESYRKFSETVASSARELGASMTDLIDSATVFARLGYSLDESETMARLTVMLKNVGDIDVADAQNAITAIVKAYGFGVDELESVMDRLVIVGNNAPISVAQIAEGMNNAGSALAAAGNDFNKTVALLTAANTTVQNISKAATGLRTVAARIRNTGTELDELGESMTDSDYDALVKALTNANVQLTGINGEFRSTYEIFSDIAKAWGNMSSMQQAALAETLAGNRQQNVFYSIVNSFREAEHAMELMDDSAGTLEQSYSELLDSITVHINSFKAAFQELSQAVIDSDITTDIIDRGTSLLDLLTGLLGGTGDLIRSIGGINNVLTITVTLLAMMNTSKIVSMAKSLKDFSLFTDLIAAISLGVESYNKHLLNAGRSAVGLGTKISALGAGFSGFAESLGIANWGVSAFIAVIGAAVFAYNKYQQSLENARKAALESAEQYKEVSDGIDEYKRKIFELKDALDNGNLSAKEAYDKRLELLDIKQELLDFYGAEASAIDVVGDSAEATAKKLDELKAGLANTELSKNKGAYDRARSEMEIERYLDLGLVSGGSLDRSGYADRIKGIFEANGISISGNEANGYVASITADARTAQSSISSTMAALRELRNELIRDGVDLADVFGDYDFMLGKLSDALNNTDGIIDKYGDLYDNYINFSIITNSEYAEAYNELAEAQKAYNDALVGEYDSDEERNRAIAAAIERINSIDLSNLHFTDDTQGVKKFLDDLYNAIYEASKKEQLKISLRLNSIFNRLASDTISGLGAVTASDFYNALNNNDSRANNLLERSGLSAEELVALLIETGHLVDDLLEKEEAAAAKTQGLSEEALKNIKSLKDAISSLNDAYDDLLDDDSKGVTFSHLEKIREEFSAVENVDEYINRLAEAGTDIEKVHDILNELATAKVRDEAITAAMNGANEAYIRTLLREAGVTNDDIVAHDILSYAKGKLALESAIAEGKLDKFVDSLKDEAAYSGVAKSALIQLAAQMVATNTTGMDFNSQIASLKTLAITAGIATDAVDNAMKTASEMPVPEFDEYGNMTVESIEAFKNHKRLEQKDDSYWVNKYIQLFNNKNLDLNLDLDLFDPDKDGGKGSGSKSKVDEYVAEIDELYKAKKRLESVQNKGSLIDFGIESFNEDLTDNSEIVKRFTDNIDTVTDKLREMQKVGNVDLVNRVKVDISDENRDIIRSWGMNIGDDESGYMTVASQTYTINDTGAIVVTPILPDGSLLTQDELENYLDELLRKSKDSSILDNDELGLVLGVFDEGDVDKTLEAADEFAIGVHDLHEELITLKEDLENISEYSNNNKVADKLELYRGKIANLSEEIDAYNNLSRLRRASIERDAEKLRELGFEVNYNAEANELLIGNMERLNELTADSAGEYDSLQEATNALRKETEELISGMEDYNSANQDADESIRGLTSDVRSAREEMVEYLTDMVSSAGDLVSSFKSVYDTFHKAAQEYAETGYIMLDTFQSIMEMGPQYLSFLEDENGLLQINDERLNAVIKAKTEDLALETARSYVERLSLAAKEESLERLENLIDATTRATDASWGLLYVQLQTLDIPDRMKAQAARNLDAIRALAAGVSSGIGDTSKSALDSLNDMQGGLDDIIKYVMDLLKHQNEQEIKSIEDLKKNFAELVDLRKKNLDAAKKEADYEKDIADRAKEMTKLQRRIDALRLDNSRSANAERLKLEEELAEMQAELADKQSDHAIEAQKEALDKMQEDYETQKDSEIKKLEDELSSQQKLYDKAIAYIDEHWDTLYNELIDWNYEYGSSLDTEITDAWEKATAAVRRYGSAVKAASGLGDDIKNADGTNHADTLAATDGDGWRSSDELASEYESQYIDDVVGRMKERSRKWSEPGADKDSLHEGNKRDADILRYFFPDLNIGPDGVWYIDKARTRKLYDEYGVYHTGGIVGKETKPKDNEMLALLEKGELVLNSEKKDGLYSVLDFVENVLSKFGNMVNENGISNIFRDMSAEYLRNPNLVAAAPAGGASVQFGDVYIYGADRDTVEQHKEVNRRFVNEVLDLINPRR